MITRVRALFLSAAVIVSLFAPIGATAAAPSTPTSVTAAQLPALLTVDNSGAPVAYNRDRFEHWIDADGDGCNTRYEVLISQSTTAVDISPSGCKLTRGLWVSPYDGQTLTTTSATQIDHVVALSEAWRSGAWSWTDAQRRSFANDLGVPYALTVSSPSSNASKSDKDPDQWLPTNAPYTCAYVTSWALVKYRWTLTVDSAERTALERVLTGGCGSNVVALPAVVGPGSGATGAPGSGSATGGEPFAAGVTRLAGAGRYDTALAVSARYKPGVPAVFIATGTTFPDALSAAAAAAALGGPLLLTTPGSLPSAVRAELVRLAPQRIYIVGGEGAVGRAVFNAVKTIAPTQRIGGASRYETSQMIVAELFAAKDTAFLATGRTFPDALAATGAAGRLGAPVVLVDGAASTVPAATVQLLRNLGTTSVVIAGGTGAVSAPIIAQLRGAGFSVRRIGGASRYDTAAAINDAYFPAGTAATAFLATGTNFPDALAGAALAGSTRSPMYVTQPSCMPDAIVRSLQRLGAPSTVILGGTTVVSNNAVAGLRCRASTKPPPVTPPPPPTRTDPINTSTCPTWAPIKGNESSMIYHVPGGQFYARTNPEDCFTTEAAAKAAGYRKSQR